MTENDVRVVCSIAEDSLSNRGWEKSRLGRKSRRWLNKALRILLGIISNVNIWIRRFSC